MRHEIMLPIELNTDAMRSKPDWGGFLAALNEAVAE